MLLQILQVLLITIFGKKQQATYDLHKKQSVNLQGINWSFIFVTVALITFFAMLLVLMITGTAGVESGNYYYHLR